MMMMMMMVMVTLLGNMEILPRHICGTSCSQTGAVEQVPFPPTPRLGSAAVYTHLTHRSCSRCLVPTMCPPKLRCQVCSCHFIAVAQVPPLHPPEIQEPNVCCWCSGVAGAGAGALLVLWCCARCPCRGLAGLLPFAPPAKRGDKQEGSVSSESWVSGSSTHGSTSA